jgi:hypothetical protein
MTTFAAQAGNPHWQWWVEAMGGPSATSEYHAHGDYITYVHGALPDVAAKPHDDLPSSRVFRGIGQAFLNSNLTDGAENVQVVFKSSPFGTQSHGYEANNSFNLWAYGEHMLIRTGRRDSYGSDHHKNWMWSTRSTNCIRIGGKGPAPALVKGSRKHYVRSRQLPRRISSPARPRVSSAPSSLSSPNSSLSMTVLVSPEPTFYEYWLHAVTRSRFPTSIPYVSSTAA